MDIINMLKDDHKAVKELFETLCKTTTAATKTRVSLLAKIEHELRVHMQFEEQYLYPAVKAGSDKEGKELTNESYAEHGSALVSLENAKSTPPANEMWKAWFTVLKEGVEHHIKEEEGDLFKRAKHIIPADVRAKMGDQYAAIKARAKHPTTHA